MSPIISGSSSDSSWTDFEFAPPFPITTPSPTITQDIDSISRVIRRPDVITTPADQIGKVWNSSLNQTRINGGNIPPRSRSSSESSSGHEKSAQKKTNQNGNSFRGNGHRSRSNSECSVQLDELPVCDEHQLIHEFFCYDCYIEVCANCIKARHNKHSFEPSLTYKQLFERTEKARGVVRENINVVQEQLSNLQMKQLVASDSIRMCFQKFHDLLDERESQLQKDVAYIVECRAKILKQKLKENQEDLWESETIMGRLVENYSIRESGGAGQSFRNGMKQLKKLGGLHRTNLKCLNEDVIFYPPNENVYDIIKNMGLIDCPSQVATYSANTRGSVVKVNNNISGVTDKNLDPFRLFAPSTQNLQNAWPPEYTFSCPFPSQTSLTEPVTGDIFNLAPISLVDAEPPLPINFVPPTLFPVSFLTERRYNRIRKPVIVIGKEGSTEGDLCRPWGVCCDRNGQVIIADRSNHRIQIFRTDGSHVRNFGSHGTGEGEFDRPAGVAIDFYGRIVVTDKDNHRVQVFSMEGEFVFAFGERGHSNGKFNYPWDVDVSSKGLIVISDTRNHRIQLFSHEGTFLQKFGYENLSSMWKSPRGVCFTPEDTVIVTDFDSHKIYEIEFSNGRIPRILKQEFKRCELFRPQGVAMDSTGNILVADSRNHRIVVFRRNGEYTGSFGIQGKEIGQFERPSGISLTPDGKIVVVDFGNHRVQIF